MQYFDFQQTSYQLHYKKSGNQVCEQETKNIDSNAAAYYVKVLSIPSFQSLQ